jgi:hypothetical protein
MHLQLNDQTQTWDLVDLKPDEAAFLFRVLDDEVTRARRRPCETAGDHEYHAGVVILHSVMIEGGLRAQLHPATQGATVKS